MKFSILKLIPLFDNALLALPQKAQLSKPDHALLFFPAASNKILDSKADPFLLGGERFADRLMDWAAGAVRDRKRSSYSDEGLRGHDEMEAATLLQRGLSKLWRCGKPTRASKRWPGW